MCKTPKITLSYLINYIPNDTEKLLYEKLNIQVLKLYLEDTKRWYFKEHYYLGGQTKMTIDDEITLELINRTKDIFELRLKEYGCANSWEVASVKQSQLLLNQMEEIVKFHIKLTNT
jgi:hypothetical protein